MKFVLVVAGAYIGYNYFQSKAAQADPIDSILNVLMVGGSLASIIVLIPYLAKD
jgi:hypothetical protein